MAGSWNHATAPDGQLYRNKDLNQMLENGGDWSEFAEEAYGMVWKLAYDLSEQSGVGTSPAELIEEARQHYQDGLERSPGTDGRLPEDDD